MSEKLDRAMKRFIEKTTPPETKLLLARISDLEKRISVAVKFCDYNKRLNGKLVSYVDILLMSQPDFDKFCQDHPEYLPS